jgi:hypothetical protein
MKELCGIEERPIRWGRVIVVPRRGRGVSGKKIGMSEVMIAFYDEQGPYILRITEKPIRCERCGQRVIYFIERKDRRECIQCDAEHIRPSQLARRDARLFLTASTSSGQK